MPFFQKRLTVCFFSKEAVRAYWIIEVNCAVSIGDCRIYMKWFVPTAAKFYRLEHCAQERWSSKCTRNVMSYWTHWKISSQWRKRSEREKRYNNVTDCSYWWLLGHGKRLYFVKDGRAQYTCVLICVVVSVLNVYIRRVCVVIATKATTTTVTAVIICQFNRNMCALHLQVNLNIHGTRISPIVLFLFRFCARSSPFSNWNNAHSIVHSFIDRNHTQHTHLPIYPKSARTRAPLVDSR